VQARVARKVIIAAALASVGLAGASSAQAAPSDQYVVRNLVSSSAAVPADRFDPNLKNPWGLVSSPTSPWWPANNGTNTSTIIPATGAVNNTVVQVPGGPTGIVWNGTAGAFPITGGQSTFIFNTMSGQISGWRGATAEVKVNKPASFYLGMTLAVTATGPQLYSTDFKGNKIDVVDKNWADVDTTGKFVDPTLPANYGPYGIQAVGNRIFVTYAEHATVGGTEELPGAGKGYVSAYDFAGNFLGRVASTGVLNAPWGIAKADPNFGAFGGDLLIGNFGDGRINAFHENADGTWTPSGGLKGTNGQPLSIGGLWAIQFGSGTANNGQRNHLYFTAGSLGETQGLFGRIIPNPSEAGGVVPATLALTLGTPASFGPFTPGVAKDYTAATTANVVSSAGDATLTVADPSTTNTGKLVNGAFTLAQAVSASATSAAGTAGAGGPVGGSAAPTTLLTYAGPTSNDAVTVNFKQSIGANEALRTGSYSKTFTFTLSTTTP
jgi:uncharacterized protein (TIGR03118 family)